MPSLSLIESEARQLVGSVSEARLLVLQQALLALCEEHWLEMRGPEPTTSLAHVLWTAMPARADLLADLYASGDGRLDALLPMGKAAQAFALLALAEIEHGNAEAARLAHEPMMLFESPAVGARYAERIAAALRGAGGALPVHPHASKPALWKALASMVALIGRCDLDALVCVIGLLVSQPAAGQAADEALEQLRSKVDETGVRFLGIDDSHINYEVHGHAHKPVSFKQLGEMLGEMRQAWQQ